MASAAGRARAAHNHCSEASEQGAWSKQVLQFCPSTAWRFVISRRLASCGIPRCGRRPTAAAVTASCLLMTRSRSTSPTDLKVSTACGCCSRAAPREPGERTTRDLSRALCLPDNEHLHVNRRRRSCSASCTRRFAFNLHSCGDCAESLEYLAAWSARCCDRPSHEQGHATAARMSLLLLLRGSNGGMPA